MQAGWFPTGRQKSLKPSLSKDPVEVEEFQAPQAKGPNSWQSWRGPRFLLGLAAGILVGAVMKAALLRPALTVLTDALPPPKHWTASCGTVGWHCCLLVTIRGRSS
ncbi:unnamed protein product [Symbiodinium necroappetens]|uniref:Uncharacterized protein n=1 Tax=Symbiodinium necroappetens TaxID=1628268 RepID=A0A812TGF0_9DINO|nr:unnamed protein product [Symbiodinium necroappetens]